jgi:hypothetical protein
VPLLGDIIVIIALTRPQFMIIASAPVSILLYAIDTRQIYDYRLEHGDIDIISPDTRRNL